MVRRLSLTLVAVTLALTGCSNDDPAPSASNAESPEPILTTGVFSPILGDLDVVVDLLSHPVNYSSLEHSPFEGEWGYPLREAGFEALAYAGFTAIRLPVRFSAHQQLTAPYTIDEQYLNRVDWAIDQALSHGMAVIVDNHHWGVEGRDDWDLLFYDPESQRARLEAIWEQVAPRYADQPVGVVFEILNEPHDALDEYWNEYQAGLLAIIRESNPDRAVIVTPAHWGSPWALGDLELPEDDNLIVTFHDYIPFDFTHQGATWVTPQPPVGVVWPEPTVRLSSAWEDWSWDTTRTFTESGWSIRGDAEWAGVFLHSVVGFPGVTEISLTTSTPVELWVDCRNNEEAESTPAHFTTVPDSPQVISTDSCGLDGDLQNIRIMVGPNAGTSYTLTEISLTTPSGTWELLMTAEEELVEPLDFAVEWAAAHGDVPLFIGEYGASYLGDQKSRERWVRTIVGEADARDILTSYWDCQGTWGFWTPNDGVTEQWLLDAVLGR
ncbi:MAG: glycoside hydrolase family 5 protein [Demequinaceae bacterium]|nr:glycoside hydrolase family 5 protein [Demequinaceae bacterium]